MKSELKTVRVVELTLKDINDAIKDYIEKDGNLIYSGEVEVNHEIAPDGTNGRLLMGTTVRIFFKDLGKVTED